MTPSTNASRRSPASCGKEKRRIPRSSDACRESAAKARPNAPLSGRPLPSWKPREEGSARRRSWVMDVSVRRRRLEQVLMATNDSVLGGHHFAFVDDVRVVVDDARERRESPHLVPQRLLRRRLLRGRALRGLHLISI